MAKIIVKSERGGEATQQGAIRLRWLAQARGRSSSNASSPIVTTAVTLPSPRSTARSPSVALDSEMHRRAEEKYDLPAELRDLFFAGDPSPGLFRTQAD